MVDDNTGFPYGPAKVPRPIQPPRPVTGMQDLVARGMSMLAAHAPSVAAGIANDATGFRARTRQRVTDLQSAGLTPEAVTKFRTDELADARNTFHLTAPGPNPAFPPTGAMPPGLRPARTPEQIAAFRTARTNARTAARKTYTDAMTAYRASLNKPPTP